MEKILAILNQLEREGIIGHYAIGGAVAATRYIEPIQTYDLDVFVMLPVAPSGSISLTAVYARLKQLGYSAEGESVVIEDWPVQFLPVFNPLTDEALLQALEVRFGATPTRVLSAEYLAAIMLDTGRSKDHTRLVQFFESGILDRTVLESIIARHGLMEKWQRFRTRFLNEEVG
ncbi:MAG TPA: hypothetical protein PKZ84_07915 [Anaerolineae bacterium]|nr:hypothetical protein [Anaerolineae bacterium]HQI84350.1 hypothetical protein [Anaerolineae bacterium]